MFRAAILACVGIGVAAAGSLSAARPGPGARVAPAQRQSDGGRTPHVQRYQQGSRPRPDGPASALKPLLDRYCVTCHNGRLKTAGLMLDMLDLQDVSADAVRWEKVVAKLRSGAMPPAGAPRPGSDAYESMAASLEAALDRAAEARPRPGRPAVHRLNRAEYTNAIRDLLAVEIDGRSLLPADDSGYGFDNIADVLSMSPALLDRYMIAAGRISRMAVGDPSVRPAVSTYSLRPTLVQDGRMSELLPFGSRGGLAARHYFPVDGEYVIKIRLQRTHANQIRGLGERNLVELRLDRTRVKTFSVGAEGPRDPWSAVPSASFYEQTADEGLDARVHVKAGMRTVGVAFPSKGGVPEGVLEPRLSVATYEYAGDRDSAMSLDSIRIDGPYNPTVPEASPSRTRIFLCQPARREGEDFCARKILSTLARRAYRRAVTEEDIRDLMGYYKTGRAKGTFDQGIELALRAMLVDPDFLFRIEHDPSGVAPGRAYRLTDVELASRLSFFLWSSIPDDELLDAAEAGKLRDRAVLAGQVRRMLRDARSNALITNFAGQWLYLRNLEGASPDPDAFPDFDDNLREAFRRETELFVESQLREDRSVTDLLTSNYTFVNERLARHYEIPKVYGNQFRRVTLPDETRRGLLGHGSILTVTSYANRTSPTLRGKWVLENLLGAPPPPPPPNVPALDDSDGPAALTVRERMEQHRKNPVCASCHAPMDPLGLALENFDAIGKWRTREGQAEIDSSAVLPDGARFSGPTGLRGVVIGRGNRFAATVTEKLLTYAIGRGLDHYDAPVVRKVLREAASDDHRWSSLVLGIVTSAPFQMRQAGG